MEDIVFAGVAKTPEEIRAALDDTLDDGRAQIIHRRQELVELLENERSALDVELPVTVP
jgi:hypothetical protein